MKKIALWTAVVAAAAWGFPAAADLTVTVQISGSIEEIMPILQLLQQTGLDKAAKEHMDGLKLQIDSVATEGGAVPPVPPPAPIPPEVGHAEATPTTLAVPGIDPQPVKPGESVLVTVAVTDPKHRVDTVAVQLDESGQYGFDLYDDGTHGDVTAGDGVWSFRRDVPADAPAGDVKFHVHAFDANGDPVTEPNAQGEPQPVMTEGAFTVQP